MRMGVGCRLENEETYTHAIHVMRLIGRANGGTFPNCSEPCIYRVKPCAGPMQSNKLNGRQTLWTGKCAPARAETRQLVVRSTSM